MWDWGCTSEASFIGNPPSFYETDYYEIYRMSGSGTIVVLDATWSYTATGRDGNSYGGYPVFFWAPVVVSN